MQHDDQARRGRHPDDALGADTELGGRRLDDSGTTEALVGGPGADLGQAEYTTARGTHGGADVDGDYPPGGGPAAQGGTTSEPDLDEDASTNV